MTQKKIPQNRKPNKSTPAALAGVLLAVFLLVPQAAASVDPSTVYQTSGEDITISIVIPCDPFCSEDDDEGGEGTGAGGGTGGQAQTSDGSGGAEAGAEAEAESNSVPTQCTAEAGSSCKVACTAGSNSRGSIIVYATKDGGSGYIKTEAIGECVHGGSVSTESHVSGDTTTASMSTIHKGTITCKVSSYGGATGSGRCWEPDPIISEVNGILFCLIGTYDPAPVGNDNLGRCL